MFEDGEPGLSNTEHALSPGVDAFPRQPSAPTPPTRQHRERAMKKFRPPLLRRVSGASPDEPPPKKQRVAELPDARPNTSSDTSNPPPRAVTKPTAAKKNPVLLSQKYRPVAAPVTPAAPPETSFGISTTQGGAEGYYNVLW